MKKHLEAQSGSRPVAKFRVEDEEREEDRVAREARRRERERLRRSVGARVEARLAERLGCLTCGEPSARDTRCERCKRNIEEDRERREVGL
jgi:hypothetical protein